MAARWCTLHGTQITVTYAVTMQVETEFSILLKSQLVLRLGSLKQGPGSKFLLFQPQGVRFIPTIQSVPRQVPFQPMRRKRRRILKYSWAIILELFQYWKYWTRWSSYLSNSDISFLCLLLSSLHNVKGTSLVAIELNGHFVNGHRNVRTVRGPSSFP